MEFRLLSVEDLPLVSGMEGDFRSKFVMCESARRFLVNPQNLLFACVSDNRILGFAYGYRHPRLDEQGDKVYIHEVGVLPQWQRGGIGRALIETIRDYCLLEGCSSFFLFTQRSNAPACRLYEATGGVDSQGDNQVYWFDLGTRGNTRD